ncbi:MAG: DUF488 domain-containing protein [Planctomycetota bacterium]|nr:DUF488 domain-containing protein [Planctomycetota bacterium]
MSESDNKISIRIFTLGYAGKNARQFFTILKQAGIRKVIDVRLYNTSQLAGFTKRQDIKYFLQAIVGAEYIHLPIMAPTKQLLNDYKKGLISWQQYEIQFKGLITQRQIEKHLVPQDMDMSCFLCSETKADNCHRRLVAEYLAEHWQNASIHHL